MIGYDDHDLRDKAFAKAQMQHINAACGAATEQFIFQSAPPAKFITVEFMYHDEMVGHPIEDLFDADFIDEEDDDEPT